MCQNDVMNPFDSYMLNKVRRLKDARARYAATGEKAVLRWRTATGGTPVAPCVDGATASGRRSSSGSSTAKARRCSRRTPSAASCDSAAATYCNMSPV